MFASLLSLLVLANIVANPCKATRTASCSLFLFLTSYGTSQAATAHDSTLKPLRAAVDKSDQAYHHLSLTQRYESHDNIDVFDPHVKI